MEKRKIPWLIRVLAPPLAPLLHLLARYDWRDVQKLPSGGFVLCPNHISWVEPFTFAYFQYRNNVPPRFLAKAVLFDLPIGGWILRHSEQIPVYRATENAQSAFRAAAAAVRNNQPVTVYPEGTITRDDDLWPMRGKTGAVRIALETGCPLVPAAQWGAQEIWWPYSKRIRPFPRKTLIVKIGDPVDLSDFYGKEMTTELLDAATDRLMDAITELLIGIRGERPTRPRLDARAIVAKEAAEKAAKRAAKQKRKRAA